MYLLSKTENPAEPLARLLKRNSSDNAVDFITERQEILSEMTSVLSGDAGDQCSFQNKPGSFNMSVKLGRPR